MNTFPPYKTQPYSQPYEYPFDAPPQGVPPYPNRESIPPAYYKGDPNLKLEGKFGVGDGKDDQWR